MGSFYSSLLFQRKPQSQIEFPSTGRTPNGGGVEIGTEGILPTQYGTFLTKVENIFAAPVDLKALPAFGELCIENTKRS